MADSSGSILERDDASGRWMLRVGGGPRAGQRMVVELSGCEYPTCGCADVTFTCVPIEGSAEPRDPVRFRLAVFDRCVSRAAGGEAMTPEGRALGKAVAGELGEADWRRLCEYLYGLKRAAMENMDIARMEADFPPEVMAGDVTVVGYGEMFPFEPEIVFDVDGQRWLADDAYCVAPGCGCRETILYFFHVPEAPDADGVARVRENVPTARYDYEKGESEGLRKPAPGQPSIERLLDAMKTAHVGFDALARQRHSRLATLFLNSVARSSVRAMPLRREGAKVGRNDPCPCGSGKKYKKCCGALAEPLAAVRRR